MNFKRILIWLMATVMLFSFEESVRAHYYSPPKKGKHSKKKKSKYKRKKKGKKKTYSAKVVYKLPVEKKIYPQSNWAKEVLKELTLEQKIGQLFMVAAYSNRGKEHVDNIVSLIENQNIGGLIFFQGGPYRQANLTNYYQSLSKIPLLISIDGEWGISMRLDSTINYPKQLTLGAIQQEELIYKMGGRIADECSRIGIHVNFAPVIDVNNNPNNPVIGFRSFGEDKENVSSKGLAYMFGLQDNNVIACAKHFPGHGDTEVDSHKGLPTLSFGKERMDSLELYPFKELFEEGLMSVMASHLNVPLYDTAKNVGASLSRNMVTALLKDTLKFKGLVFTDALDMKGVRSFYKPGEVDLKALLAGNDILVNSEDVPTAIKLIKSAIDSCYISVDEIDEHVKKILLAKQWVGLNMYEPIDVKNLKEDLNSPQAMALNKSLYKAALTLLSNNNIIPLKRLDTLKIANLIISETNTSVFAETVEKYTSCSTFFYSNKLPQNGKDSILSQLKNYNLVLVSVENSTRKIENNYNVNPETVSLIKNLKKSSKVILNLMANPYSLSKFAGADSLDAIVMPYEKNELTAELAAELIFGGVGAEGKLPVNASPQFKIGTGIKLTKTTRLSYVEPQEINIEKKYINKIDSIVANALQANAFPGCQVLAAKDGKVFLNKSYGSISNASTTAVSNKNIYDIASVTKVAASTLSLMRLYDAGVYNLDDTYSKYLPELKNSNKKDLTFRDQLTHQGRLKPYLPYYLQTIDSTGPINTMYKKFADKDYSIPIADSLYALNSISDSLYSKIITTSLEPQKHYLYSDMGYYFAKKFIEKETGKTLDKFSQSIYLQLGMNNTNYTPLNYFPKERIAPTENDLRFRKQLIQGYVHDQGAALLGGVAGHAGVFSNANDLAKLFQMYLNHGEYGGETIIKKSTLAEFTRCQFCKEGNRRGLGFDKPEPNPKKGSPCSRSASLESFGHSGFTGTFAWADPANGLVYIFLSNRVNPDASNNKLVEMNVRSKIQDVLYEAIKEK
jgi:beta-glucosidase-like glycosyl hydrolase/CubicO group peptidase (beta-lactamase class C family)